MSPYTRTSTPQMTFVDFYGSFACFRLHLGNAERLNGLLYRGEIAEFLMKEQIERKIGNAIPGYDLPENPKKADFFVMVERSQAHRFTRAFDVSGAHPYLTGEG